MTNGSGAGSADGPDSPYARFDPDPLRVWLNDGASGAQEVAQELGMADLGAGRGLLTIDYDRDGDLDLFVVNDADTAVLLRNDRADGNGWLRVRCVGVDSNRSGIGARVRVWATADTPPQTREIDGGSHFLGQSEAVAHFGLGRGTGPVHRVEVSWPATGRTQVFDAVARNAELVAVEPAAVGGAAAGNAILGDAEPPSASGGESGGGGGSACGLLGVEPLVVLFARRRRRS